MTSPAQENNEVAAEGAGKRLESIIKGLTKLVGEGLVGETRFRGETSVTLKLDALRRAMEWLKKEGFDYLIDVSTVDHEDREPRFEVVYELYRMGEGIHLRIKADVPEELAEVPTVSDLWATANWHEREAWDMMGIRFTDHPDLRRIIMWEGYPYYPLRKEFPLAGRPSEMPDVAFTGVAPLEGGPFVTHGSVKDMVEREPRAKGES